MDIELLRAYGIDYEKGVHRCMDDPAFYQVLLSMFLQDDSFQRAKAAYESGSAQALFSAVHELKGACGNAAMTELYDAVCPLVELLRGGTQQDAETVARLFSAMEAAYTRTREGVSRAISQ